MDLGAVSKKLDKGEYSDISELNKDMKLGPMLEGSTRLDLIYTKQQSIWGGFGMFGFPGFRLI